jgi:Nuclease-related domain
MSSGDPAPGKTMKLRYAGTCHGCGQRLPAGQPAVYHSATRQIECFTCAGHGTPDLPSAADIGDPTPTSGTTTTATAVIPAGLRHAAAEPEHTAPPAPVESGTAGTSARREHQRRVAKREASIRAAHPRIGNLILALSDEPQHTQAWARGARGEELPAKQLDALGTHGVLLLHDRRIPPTRANIDHIAISTAGVFVIDAKRYKGRPSLHVQGGVLRPRTETLLVGRRDCTKLLAGITKQVDRVRSAIVIAGIVDVPVHGMLCFVEADWPLIGGSFKTAAIAVLWPKKAAEMVATAGSVSGEAVAALHRQLANAFPSA